MSLDTRGIDPRRPEGQRLLPQSLEDRLLRLLGRGAGAIVFAGVMIAWISLLSWSVKDPSLTHATTAEPQNWLGSSGAILSDLMLQTLGFASALAVIAPLAWSLDLMRRSRVKDGRLKFGFYPLSVLALAGAVSALPVFGAWPLHHGFGGALGDGLFRAIEGLFALINADRAAVASGIVLTAAAVSMMAKSTGFQLDVAARQAVAYLRGQIENRQKQLPPVIDVSDSLPEPQLRWPKFAAPAATQSACRHDPQGAPQAAGTASAFASGVRDAVLAPAEWQGEDQSPEFAAYQRGRDGATISAIPADVFTTAPAELTPPPRFLANAQRSDFAPAELPQTGQDDATFRDPEFDAFTDAASRAIAARFAPGAREVKPVAEARPAPAVAIASKVSPKPVADGNASWSPPSLNLLKRGVATKPGPEISQTAMRGNARLIEDVLADFGVKGEIKSISPGPVVTLYDFEPARGVKSARVIGLSDDIARSMSVASVRAAVVPGRNAIGLELPNARRDPVMLREILESDACKSSEAALPLALGKNISGAPIVVDLARMPHLLVAGTTGSGKSVGVNAMIVSLLYRCAPEDCRMLMIDPKMLELSVYNGIPHLLTPVVTDPHKAVAALNWAVAEMEERYKRMAALSVRNIDVFNNRVRNAKQRGEVLSRTVQTGFDAAGLAVMENQKIALETMPHIVIVVDEFADLMMVAGKEVEGAVQRLAQMARASGIHLIMATQRPSVDVLTGTIKANFPTRISFKVTSKIDSRTILNEQGAEQLLGHGDMLYSSGAGQLMRVHGAFVGDDEVETIAEALRQQRPPAYVPGLLETPEPDHGPANIREASDSDLYDRAVAIVMRDRKASTSYLQRRLSIGYNRAADLIERMETGGLITPANGVGRRDILMTGTGGD